MLYPKLIVNHRDPGLDCGILGVQLQSLVVVLEGKCQLALLKEAVWNMEQDQKKVCDYSNKKFLWQDTLQDGSFCIQFLLSNFKRLDLAYLPPLLT